MSERNERCRFWPKCSVHVGYARRPHRGDGHLTESEAAYVRDLREGGWRIVDIAAHTGWSVTTVSNISRGITHRAAP